MKTSQQLERELTKSREAYLESVERDDYLTQALAEAGAEVERLKTDLRRSIKIADVLKSGGSRACRELHHSKRDQHEYGEVCPVEERLEKAESELDQLKATLNPDKK
jgi:predicted RNase H-like nuclease (RuvC/YqgF family)